MDLTSNKNPSLRRDKPGWIGSGYSIYFPFVSHDAAVRLTRAIAELSSASRLFLARLRIQPLHIGRLWSGARSEAPDVKRLYFRRLASVFVQNCRGKLFGPVRKRYWTYKETKRHKRLWKASLKRHRNWNSNSFSFRTFFQTDMFLQGSKFNIAKFS